MGTYSYAVSVDLTPEDTLTFAAKRNYKIKECNDSLVSNEAGLWCNNLCGQDEAYCNPFVKGDKIYFQYFADTAFWKVLPKIYDDATGLIIPSEAYITKELGIDINGNFYLNVILDTTDLPIDCFSMQTYVFVCEPNELTYDACVLNAISLGATPEEAELECSITVCGSGTSIVYSEPYCSIPCERSILLEGIYPTKDCNGQFYGAFEPNILYSPTNSHKLQIRIPAELIKENFQFVSTVVNNNKQKSTQTDVYLLKSVKIPPYVAEKIATCFNAKQLFIDGIEYISGAEVTKNNDFGQMWIINNQLTKKCSEINFTCE